MTEGEFSSEQRADIDQWAGCITGAIDVADYIGLMQAAGFVDIQVMDKVDAGGIVEAKEGLPRLYSARFTGFKPEDS